MKLPQVMPMEVKPPKNFGFKRQLELLASDRHWAVERKFDGWRCMVIYDERNLILLNKRGQPYQILPAELYEELKKLFKQFGISSIILDAEIVGYDGDSPNRNFIRKHGAKKSLFVFDLLFLNGENYCNEIYENRKRRLKSFISIIEPHNSLLHYVPYILGSAESAHFISEQWRENHEGVVFKHRLGLYPDTRNPWIKFKNSGYGNNAKQQ